MKGLSLILSLALLGSGGAALAGEKSASGDARPFAFHDAPVVTGKAEPVEFLRSLAATRAKRTIYVSASDRRAADDNNGSPNAPVRTLDRAATLATESLNTGASTRLILLPGEHSGKLTFTRGPLNDTGAATPLVIEGAGVDKTVLTALVTQYRSVS